MPLRGGAQDDPLGEGFQIWICRPPAVGLWLGDGWHAPTISPEGKVVFKLGFICLLDICFYVLFSHQREKSTKRGAA